MSKDKNKGLTNNDYLEMWLREHFKESSLDSKYVIVDVRRFDEYEEGHIPNSINIPNESIVERPKELADIEERIYVYCRSGNRSAQASSKLKQLGYNNVIDCGSINSWMGELEK